MPPSPFAGCTTVLDHVLMFVVLWGFGSRYLLNICSLLKTQIKSFASLLSVARNHLMEANEHPLRLDASLACLRVFACLSMCEGENAQKYSRWQQFGNHLNVEVEVRAAAW